MEASSSKHYLIMSNLNMDFGLAAAQIYPVNDDVFQIAVGLYQEIKSNKFVAAVRFLNRSGNGPTFNPTEWEFFKKYIIPITNQFFKEEDNEDFDIYHKKFVFRHASMNREVKSFIIEQTPLTEFHTSETFFTESKWLNLVETIPEFAAYLEYIEHLAKALNDVYISELIDSILTIYREKYSGFYIFPSDFIEDFIMENRTRILKKYYEYPIENPKFEFHKPTAAEILLDYYIDFLITIIMKKLKKINKN